MKLVWTHRRFAWCLVLVGISSWTGCGGGSSTPPAASQASAPPASAPPGDPASAGAPAQDPTAMTAPPSDGYAPPPSDTAVAPGMPTGDGYVSDGYVPPSGDMAGGGLAGFGMPGMGMPGMGMPGMPGMPGMGMPGGMQAVDPAPADDADYMTKARYAFAIGKEAEAAQYYIAHVMSREEEAAGLLEQVRWSPAARRPALAVRFAVGVDLKAPPNIPDVKPIGRSQMAGNTPGGGGGDSAGMDMAAGAGAGAGAGPGGGGGKTFGDLTGLFGEALMNAFESAWDNGDFGLAFKDIETIQPAPPRPNMGMPGMGLGGMDSSGGGIPGAESGSGYDPGMIPGAGVPNPLAAPKDPALRMRAVAGKQVVPGLLFLGTGSPNELAAKAEKQGIDYLFVFEVNVKAQRGMIQNDTRLRLIPAVDKEGAVTVASSVLNNLKVDRERMQKGETDDLDKQIGNVFRKVESLKMAELPKLAPAQAQARVKSLIDKKSSDVLPTLMEIRLYNALGVLDNDERDAAYQLLMGGTGLAFVIGTVEDRESVLNPLLPSYK